MVERKLMRYVRKHELHRDFYLGVLEEIAQRDLFFHLQCPTRVKSMTSSSPQDMNRFGGAVDSAEEAGLMIVGNEFSEINGCARKDFIELLWGGNAFIAPLFHLQLVL